MDAAGVERSRQAVEALIAAERARGVAASRIVIAGFSQGGAMALDIGLRHAERLGGILCLSAYLARPDALAAVAANRPTPVLMGHGLYDQVVPRFLGQQSAEALRARACRWTGAPTRSSTASTPGGGRYRALAGVGLRLILRRLVDCAVFSAGWRLPPKFFSGRGRTPPGLGVSAPRDASGLPEPLPLP
ncbi:MAG: hypothetical protein R3F43_16950 [bacterium]